MEQKKGAQAALQAKGVDSPLRPESARFGVAAHQSCALRQGNMCEISVPLISQAKTSEHRSATDCPSDHTSEELLKAERKEH